MAASREENPDLVDQFVAVTGATRSVAVSMLEACAGNLDLAVGMHMDGQGAAGPSSSIQEDTAVASGAGSSNHGENGDVNVRAPIPQKTEVLVDDDDGYKFASWRMRRPRRMVRSVFDGFRDFQAEAKNYEDGIHGKSMSKKRNLEDLFRPPVDITHKGTFQSARDLGSSNNQWLLVNVQNVQEFECQVLNRDVWSCQAAKKLITASFIFWQVYNDSAEGKRFMQFYKVSKWPYVAIVDPFTGENQIAWHKISDGKTFCELANEFLALHPAPNLCDSSSPPSKRQKRESIVDASEQDQMEAAIQASLQENNTKPSKSPLYVIDSDSEPDLIEDSEDDVETFSDSDTTVESTPVNKKSSRQNLQTKLTKVFSTSTSSSSSLSTTSSSLSSSSTSWCSTKPNTNRIASDSTVSSFRKHHKDSYSKCKNLSASKKTSCTYTPLSFNPDHCGESNMASTSTCSWNDPTHATSVIDNSLGVGVDVDNFCRDSEVCTLSNSPSNSQTSDITAATNTTSSHSLDWKHFWGDESDPKSKIMMRFPDSKREQVELPCSSSLKALKTYCASLGFTEDKYELVTNFPRRKLSELDDTKVLKDIGLYPQDTVFIQEL